MSSLNLVYKSTVKHGSNSSCIKKLIPVTDLLSPWARNFLACVRDLKVNANN